MGTQAALHVWLQCGHTHRLSQSLTRFPWCPGMLNSLNSSPSAIEREGMSFGNLPGVLQVQVDDGICRGR